MIDAPWALEALQTAAAEVWPLIGLAWVSIGAYAGYTRWST